MILRKLNKFIQSLGEWGEMVSQIVVLICKKPLPFSQIRNQLFEMGVLSLPVISITGISTGMVLAAQAYFQLSDKGFASTTGIMVAKSMLVEFGPILTSFMLTGRVGAAISAELGSMKVTEQIDALRSMAVDPIHYLVVPRFIAMIIMVPVLTVFSCAMGIIGGYIIAIGLYGMDPHSFLDPIPNHMTWFDVFSGLSKSCCFGILIVTICCFRGMATRGGAVGVGKATTNSVVISYTSILIANFILTIALNHAYWFVYNAKLG